MNKARKLPVAEFAEVLKETRSATEELLDQALAAFDRNRDVFETVKDHGRRKTRSDVGCSRRCALGFRRAAGGHHARWNIGRGIVGHTNRNRTAYSRISAGSRAGVRGPVYSS